ncbi:hypothetical protein OPV22_031563 [Ensete ventricosum]|uniref:Pentacotripeptide-repeat region of PRORP domain-containing protein n=1 Tax=Ensete ventricosum TaxID=4639 RepID=A0AAV8PTY2_ENSVE|nr:hypothetical protein OPV22_031563 [Ensete ventricosum]
MVELGMRPNATAYNKVIGGLVNVVRLDEAKNVFDQMLEEEVKPNVGSYELLLKGFVDSGRLEDGLKTLKDLLLDDGVTLSQEMKELVEEALRKEGRDEEMGKLYEDVEREKAERLAREAEEKARAEALAAEEEERKKREAAEKEAAAARASAAAIEAILGRKKDAAKEESPAAGGEEENRSETYVESKPTDAPKGEVLAEAKECCISIMAAQVSMWDVHHTLNSTSCQIKTTTCRYKVSEIYNKVKAPSSCYRLMGQFASPS